MFISIGINCDMATVLRDTKLRTLSLPFDWILTYNGIDEIIQNDFQDFLTPKGKQKYNIGFPHFTFPKDYSKLEERVNRLKDILSNTNNTKETIYFLRAGHEIHHHGNHAKCDIIQTEFLVDLLKKQFPQLKFKVIVFLACGNCYIPKQEYQTTKEEVRFINISTGKALDMHEKFKIVTKEILLLNKEKSTSKGC
jgi:hypothetical protein